MDYSPRYGCFRALLRQIRVDAGLTQAQLAEMLEKPQTFVSKSELGERRIDFLETVEFVEACGLSVQAFLDLLDTKLDQVRQPRKSKPRKRRKSPRRMDEQGRIRH